MSLAVSVRRWLSFGVMLAPLTTGCTSFQTITTDKWFEGRWYESEPPINHVLTLWSNRVHASRDPFNNGATLPVLAGRLFLLNEEQHGSVDAHGTVIVQMLDMTNSVKGAGGPLLGEWKFDATSLRSLKRKDYMGEGYTLVLPWEKYSPTIRDVQIQVCYVPKNGAPRHAEPQNLTLQSNDQPPPRITEREIIPGRERLEQQQALKQAEYAAPTPIPIR